MLQKCNAKSKSEGIFKSSYYDAFSVISDYQILCANSPFAIAFLFDFCNLIKKFPNEQNQVQFLMTSPPVK
jgi:hypothetical protein